MMKLLQEIKSACDSNDVSAITKAFDLSAFASEKKVIIYAVMRYCREKKISPSRYFPIFISYLLAENERELAEQMLTMCRNDGIRDTKIQDCIYHYYIKSKEDFFRQKFYDNLAILQTAGLLFAKEKFDFDIAKFCLNFISAPMYKIERRTDNLAGAIMLVNGLYPQLAIDCLNCANALYWIFDDMDKFYYMLVFEDCTLIQRFCVDSRIVTFVGSDNQYFFDFLKNPLNIIPCQIIDFSLEKLWQARVGKTRKYREILSRSCFQQLNDYYSTKNQTYYADLLRQDYKRIKILGFALKEFSLSHDICQQWIDAMNSLGCDAQLIDNQKPYENVDRHTAFIKILEKKPDIIFSINMPPDDIFGSIEISMPARDNILWIIRYRDFNPKLFQEDFRNRVNVFISCFVKEWEEELRLAGISSQRLWSSPEGINVQWFNEKAVKNFNYRTELVSVNNAAGNEEFFLKRIKGIINDKICCEIIDVIYQNLISEAQENEVFYFKEEIIEKMVLTCAKKFGIQLKFLETKNIANSMLMIEHALYRAKLIKWIIDSKIVSKISLWGTGWHHILELKKFSRGLACRKDLPLIYHNSLISLSDSPTVGIHERTFEIFASKGFPLVKRVESDRKNDILNYFKEDEDVVLFDHKEDLLRKIQHYIDNPDQRSLIISRGLEIVRCKLSSVVMARSAMDFVKKNYEIT